MSKYFRFRHLFMIGGTAVIVLYLFLTDPNNGNLTIPFLAKLATPVIAVWFAHLARKALFDYIDLSQLYYKARQSTIGAGLLFLGMCIVIYGLLGLFGNQVYAQDVKTYIPTQAQEHIVTLKKEQYALWPNHPKAGPLLV